MTVLFARRALLEDGWARDVRLTIDGGLVVDVATGARTETGDERFDTVLPGIVNAHSHAFQRALVGRTEHRPAGVTDTFWTWREAMYRLAANLDGDTLHAIAAQAYAEMLAAGYTTVVEFHYLLGGRGEHGHAAAMLDALAGAADETGIRLVYVPVLYETGDFGGAELSERQQRFSLAPDAFLAHYERATRASGPGLSVGLGVHSLRAVTPGSLALVAGRAADDGVPFHLHIAEQELEVERCIAVNGARPVRWLFDQADVGAAWTLVHATHVDPEELQLIARSGATVCLCPSTEGNLGDGLFPLEAYLGAGGQVAIGSDSHVTLDPFEELRWLEYGRRLARRQRNVAAGQGGHTGATLFAAALRGGRGAAGFAAAGIVAGAPADLLALDDGNALVAGHDDTTVLDALVFGGIGAALDRVMVDGRWVAAGGRHNRAGELARGYRAALEKVSPPEAGQ